MYQISSTACKVFILKYIALSRILYHAYLVKSGVQPTFPYFSVLQIKIEQKVLIKYFTQSERQ